MRRWGWALLALAACASAPPPADVPLVTDASVGDVVDVSVPDVVDVSAPDVVDVSAPDVVDASAPDVIDVSAPDVIDASAPDVVVDAGGACGRAGARLGRWYQTLTSRGVTRQFYVSVPANYDPARRYPLVVGLHGRDYDGIRMRDYLALESQAPNDWAIFVYPDALRRTWGTLQATGWQNGPVASMTSSFGGTDDLAFIDDMLAWMRDAYCLDPTRVFATGQSWGGDFSNVVGCFRG
jgi:polyhydroxybutyrate depolymerase